MTNTDFKRLGHRVIYTLNDADAKFIIQERRNAGIAHKRGNDPKAGQSFPGVIVADFGPSSDIRPSLEHFVTAQRNRYDQAHGIDRGEPGYPSEFKDMTQVAFDRWLDIEAGKFEIGLKQQVKTAAANIQVTLDGTDTYWATSRSRFDPETHGRWVQVVDGHDLPLPVPSVKPAAEGDFAFRPDPEGHFVDLDA